MMFTHRRSAGYVSFVGGGGGGWGPAALNCVEQFVRVLCVSVDQMEVDTTWII